MLEGDFDDGYLIATRSITPLTFETPHRPPPPGPNASPGKFGGDGAQRDMPVGPNVRDHLCQVRREGIGVGRDSGPERLSALASTSQGGSAVGVAQLSPRALWLRASASFVRCEIARRSCSADQSHDADGQIIGLGHVDGQKPNPAVAQGQQGTPRCGTGGPVSQ